MKIKFFFADALLAKLGAKRKAQRVKYDTNTPESVVLDLSDKDCVDPEVTPKE